MRFSDYTSNLEYVNLLYPKRLNIINKIHAFLTTLKAIIITPIVICVKSLRNFWIFRKQIYDFRWWEYTYLYELMIKAMEQIEEGHKKYSHTTDNCKFSKIKHIKYAKTTLERIAKDNYGSDELRNIFELYPMKTEACTYDKLGNPLLFRILERGPVFEKRMYRYIAKKEALKKQDWELFIKHFRTSEGWWD